MGDEMDVGEGLGREDPRPSSYNLMSQPELSLVHLGTSLSGISQYIHAISGVVAPNQPESPQPPENRTVN